jgi:hypothetical protein
MPTSENGNDLILNKNEKQINCIEGLKKGVRSDKNVFATKFKILKTLLKSQTSNKFCVEENEENKKNAIHHCLLINL